MFTNLWKKYTQLQVDTSDQMKAHFEKNMVTFKIKIHCNIRKALDTYSLDDQYYFFCILCLLAHDNISNLDYFSLQ